MNLGTQKKCAIAGSLKPIVCKYNDDDENDEDSNGNSNNSHRSIVNNNGKAER